MPLAVKHPYVNAWMALGFGTTRSGALYQEWPNTFTISNVLGWYASIRVDGEAYRLMGATGVPSTTAVQQSFVFTPTRSSYIMQAGPVNVNMTFLSPIEATDLVHQSMPFSYLYFTVQSTDGNEHSIQFYSDLSGEWISGNTGLESQWQINESSNFVYLQMNLVTSGPYQEINNRPQDATVYHCVKKTNSVSWQIGPADDIRGLFANGTGLNKQAQQGTNPVDNPFNTLGIAVDIGSVSSTSEPVAYALGVVRDPAIRYSNELVQIEERSSYYWSQFTNIHDVIAEVLNHFDDALSGAISLDSEILGAAGQISGNYADILSLSTRQAMGALEYTLLKSDDSFNTSDVKAFMKDMGGIGSGGVNAVDVLYSAMPVYLYLNPAILGYLLSPLLDYQESTQYTNPYAAQDLGGPFPNATGNPDGHDQKIEHSANMLIMSLAHAQASGDGSLLAQHYDLLNEWAGYLVNNTMNPVDETTSSSDGISSTNQTNLILKGIIGIGAMAKISEYSGHSDDQSRYDGIAKQYVQQWTDLASASDQLVLNFGSGSSGLIYNLYADKLLQLNLIDSSVYSLQTSFYKQQTSSWKYGIPLDSSNTSSITRSDWMLFAASSASDTTVRDTMISQVWEYAAVNSDQNLPFAISYRPDNGSWIAGQNSPAQGAMFAPLALNVPLKSVKFTGGGGSGGSNNTPVIVGATVGGVAGLGIIGALLFLFYRRRRQQQKGIYNRTDRIERVKPSKFPSESVLEPLSSTVHPGMYDMRTVPYPSQTNTSETFNANGGTPNTVTLHPATSAPFHVRNLADAESDGAADADDSSALGGGFSTSGSSRPMPVTPRSRNKSATHQDELRSEVDDLRREIERIKEERAVLNEAPPSYDEEVVNALGSPAVR
ncbi:hypothetical protein ACEPAF_4250 [Sanghuangporus sanghuang]